MFHRHHYVEHWKRLPTKHLVNRSHTELNWQCAYFSNFFFNLVIYLRRDVTIFFQKKFKILIYFMYFLWLLWYLSCHSAKYYVNFSNGYFKLDFLKKGSLTNEFRNTLYICLCQLAHLTNPNLFLWLLMLSSTLISFWCI